MRPGCSRAIDHLAGKVAAYEDALDAAIADDDPPTAGNIAAAIDIARGIGLSDYHGGDFFFREALAACGVRLRDNRSGRPKVSLVNPEKPTL